MVFLDDSLILDMHSYGIIKAEIKRQRETIRNPITSRHLPASNDHG